MMSELRRGAALAIAIAALAGAALAQAPPLSPDTAGARGAAEAAPDYPQRLALAKRMLAAMHMDTTIKGMFHQMLARAPAAAAAATDSNEKAQALMRSILEATEIVMPRAFDDMAPVYARSLTRRELEDSVAFYESPSGRAISDKLPVMARQMMGQIIGRMPEIYTEAERRFCETHSCTQAEHDAFARMRAMSVAMTAGAAAP